MKQLLLILTTALFSLFCNGQNPQWIVFNTSNSGLPNNWVPTIAIDNFGNKWFGTVYGGIAKFDNFNWTVFDPLNSGLVDYNTTKIYIDSLNNKWIALGWTGRVYQFDDFNWIVYDSSNTNGVINENQGNRDILTDKFGNILIGGNGVKSFDGVNWSNLGISPNSFIYDLALDNIKNLWIGYSSFGATYFDGISSTNYNTGNSMLPSNSITSIAIETNGVIWITNRYDGIVKIDGPTWYIYNNSNTNLPSNSFNTVVIDQNNVKWFATGNGGTNWGNGIVKYDNTSWTTYDTINSGIPSNDVISLEIDQNNNLWMGTQDDGVAVFNENGVILGIKNPAHDLSSINLYPNPTLGEIVVFVNENNALNRFQILNETMQIMKDGMLNIGKNQTTINFSELAPGIYFIQFISDSGQSIVKKLIKK